MTRKNKARHQRRVASRQKIQAAKTPAYMQLEGDAEVEITAGERIEGGAVSLAKFSMLAYTGGKMRPKGFMQDVVIDLAGMAISAGNRPILLNHDTSQIVGHSTDIAVTKNSVNASGIISGVGAAANEVIDSSANGFPWRASVGASVEQMIHVDEGETVKANGQTFDGPVLIARQTTLGEISFVPLGADNKTSATVAASLETEREDMKFQQWVEAQGFVHADLNDQQKTSLQASFDAQVETPVVAPEAPVVDVNATTADLRIAAANETARINSITRFCSDHGNPQVEIEAGQPIDLAEYAIRENLTAERAELLALRAARPEAPAVHSRNHESDCTLEAMQGAMVLSAGLDLDAPMFRTPQAHALNVPQFLRRGVNDEARQRSMEASHRFADMSAVDICAEAVRLDGHSVPQGRRNVIQAAFSGSALDSVFTSSVSASLLSTYAQSEDTTAGWVSEADVPDFKTNEREMLSKGPDLARLPRGQTAEHLSRSDTEETYKVSRYAKQFVVDEQDIIDDMLGALRETPMEMGEAAARLRPDLVYSIILANAALSDGSALFVDADHSNLQTSAGLASATLRAAIESVMTQQDNSVNLNLRPTHLIVPVGLLHTAANLVNSATLLYGADDESVVGSSNPIRMHNLTLISDSRLDNGVTDPLSGTVNAGSATTWYMAASMARTIEVGYIRGSGRAPELRSFVLSQGQWGMGWDIKMDIGAKALDYRGFNKATA